MFVNWSVPLSMVPFECIGFSRHVLTKLFVKLKAALIQPCQKGMTEIESIHLLDRLKWKLPQEDT